MTKLMVIPNKKNIDICLKYADAILLGIKDLSVNLSDTFTIEEIESLLPKLKENNIELFISLNKNMHSKDLDKLKDTLLVLDNLDIEGIFYYDISVLKLHEYYNLKTKLVWSQEHLTTNYSTMNYWYNEGVSFAYVSAELTLDEILLIRKNTNIKLIVPIFGYLPMFTSKRNLINNYLEYFNIDDKSNKYKIKKEGKEYTIVNNIYGTVVYSANILNGLKEFEILERNNIDYVTINSFDISDDILTKVLELYSTRSYFSDEAIEELIENVDKGFLYKETIYRVKKDEKK